MNINTIGLDIAKTIFHLVGLDKNGKQIQKKKLRRGQVLAYFANLPPCTIAIEGCGSAFYWQRELTKQGHRVKLLPAQYVKAHLRGNKNDYNDALAIAEASRVPELREVTPKTIEQQGIQALHRLRERTVNDRTSLSNQIRGLLAEFGIIFNQGISSIKKGLAAVLEDTENGLPHAFRDALGLKYTQFCQLEDFDISVIDNVLYVKGEKRFEREKTEGGYSVKERAYGHFERVIPLAYDVDPEQAKATYKHGVLRVEVNKSEQHKRRKIEVK